MEITREQSDKKSAILDAAVSVFSKRGFHASTIDMIAEAASVGKGTVYLYFSSKEALLGELIFRAMNAQVKEAQESLAILDPRKRLKAVLSAGKLFLSESTDLARVIMAESVEVLRNPNFKERAYALRMAYLSLVIKSLSMGQKEGAFRDDFSPTIMAKILVSLRGGIGAELMHAQAESVSEEFIEGVMSFILYGIGALES